MRKAINAACLTLAFALLLACGGGGQRPEEGKVIPTEKKRWERAEFNGMLIGKTQEEIQHVLGDPDEVVPSLRGCNAEAWKYKSITYVPPAKNTDAYVIIGFDRNYSPNAKPEEKGKSPEGRSHIVFRWQYRIEMSAAPIPEMKTTGRPRPLACVRPN